MKLGDRGSSLIQVLLVILVFSVLGLALIANVIGENKRTNKTESNMQARYMAESGLTYFEKDFKRFIDNETDLSTISIHNFKEHLQNHFLTKYTTSNGFTVGEPWSEENPEEINIKVALEGEDTLKVTSQGRDSSSTETLVGTYKIKQIADDPVFPTPNYNGLAIDFTKKDAVGLELLSILGLDLIDPTGSDRTFYNVPDDRAIGASVLFDLISANLLSTQPFKTMENNEVIATRQGEVLELDLLKGKKATLLTVNILDFNDKYDTNVVIDGGYTALGLLGIEFNDYRNIDFKKLAVIGNVIIKQDKRGFLFGKDLADSRSFTFQEGLHVKKSLIIGGFQGEDLKSKLILNGNMIVEKDLYINYADLQFGDNTTNHSIYVYNNAEIKKACINKGIDNTNKFSLLAKGNITLINNNNCSEYKGLFYSDKDIIIKTNNQPMTIKGALVGNVKVDYPEKLTYIPDSQYYGYIKLKAIELSSKGRTFKK
ncbi:hypothetical protein HHO41_02460 [Bacillus sp. DNRA2]|uniref:pilus assembly PilX N-terminal domain-containing protein n=1 Tax=Bacillus sp. DNRA2 TaxID=2723053 RepID=UPI00145F4799|nr:pilus assembly PilX N-terminal domain-containing protein [Bacillus sp. DNRA2]NMD69136.1 hypothetical protein [Bacillus sp. DNRA2]